MLKLVYFADPMCSWCYGFGPQLAKVIEHERRRHPVTLDLTMGGLRAGNEVAMDATSKSVTLEHWQHVHEATGLPFNDAAIMADGFVYDTEPACRAVVAVRRLDPNLTYDYFHAVQRAFYAEGRDTTSEHVLTDVALACGVDDAVFLETFRSDAIRDAMRHDFALTRQAQVAGFPTLCVDIGQRLYLITRGYTLAELIEEGLARLAKEPPTR